MHATDWIDRTLRRLCSSLAALAFAVLATAAAARPQDGPCTVQKQSNVADRMRDGVTLFADVYRPKEDGGYPVILMPPLAKPVEVTGPITVTLYASSSAKDTDFTAKLTDVHPDGKAILLNNGIIRASFRDSLEKPAPIEPGKAYAYKIAIWPTSNLFKAGHRIRLEISSSNFPHYDRNPNTGRRFGMDSELAIAEQTVFHDPQRPSRMVLPVMAQPITQ